MIQRDHLVGQSTTAHPAVEVLLGTVVAVELVREVWAVDGAVADPLLQPAPSHIFHAAGFRDTGTRPVGLGGEGGALQGAKEVLCIMYYVLCI